ncbi:hypothetical protein BWQ96_04606 [Gracilariopsis chorda]|uniref:Uncharacterized protein n=1 Tax=Gracilariopsis chorda TaxID=448386 RepID=A0A2V3ITZ7_9FLOR|nr:hypothetical protein BWQ96_04606 [Gracilariopsis chorda]|eukprot:PXF45601.1 hypothetical protein BWQ96_04606 [Gracilariopsis chorda]
MVPFAAGHRNGQEYTYLSMFLRPDSKQSKGGDDNLEQIYRQFSFHGDTKPPRKASRQLHSNKEDDDEDGAHSNEGFGAMDESDMADQEEVEEDFPSKAPEQEQSSRSALDSDGIKVRKQLENHQSTSERSENTDTPEDLDAIADRFGEDVDRLMMMLKKLVSQYDIRSMADVPCRAHSHWMSDFLETIAEHNENFKYYCVDTNNKILQAVQKRVGMTVDAKYIKRKFWKEGLPKVDLVFSWSGLDNMKEGNVMRYLHKLGGSGRKHKLIMLGSHSGALARSGSAEEIARFTADGEPHNFRRKPFYLAKPMRIIGDLGKDGNDKQLYVYKPWEMYPKRN